MNRENDKIYTLKEIWDGYQKYLEEVKIGDPEKVTSFFNFADGYLPKLQFVPRKNWTEVFIDTIAKTFDVEGAVAIRYILLGADGTRYNDEIQIMQLLPKSFIARVSCSMRALHADGLILDYVVDTDNIQLEGIATNEGHGIVMKDIDLNRPYYRQGGSKEVTFDPWVKNFLAFRNEIFQEYFANTFR